MSEPTLTVTQAGTDAPEPAVPATPAAPDQVVDSKGRAYVLKKMSPLEQFRLVRLIGDAPQMYINMVAPLVWIRSIDGEGLAPPASQREIDALIQRLGEEGIEAVMEAVEKLSGGAAAAAGDALKN